MKKYVSCFLFFFCLTGGCLIALFFLSSRPDADKVQEVQITETVEGPVFAVNAPDISETEEDETVAHIVLNMTEVSHESPKEQYFLVAEEGCLTVYDSTRETARLLTHMPLSEFPPDEQKRLAEGIWFGTMAEIFSYLESYSS